jgi:hypothetical protein
MLILKLFQKGLVGKGPWLCESAPPGQSLEPLLAPLENEVSYRAVNSKENDWHFLRALFQVSFNRSRTIFFVAFDLQCRFKYQRLHKQQYIHISLPMITFLYKTNFYFHFFSLKKATPSMYKYNSGIQYHNP